MNPLLIPYPEIDPVLVQLGPFAIRWYALAYIAGLVIGWQIMRRVCDQPPKLLSPVKIDDFLLWAALGVILGGRLGYVLFYKPGFYLANPLADPDPVGRRHVVPWRAFWASSSPSSPSPGATRSTRSCCRTWWPSWCRSACSSAAWPTSSTASCGAGSSDVPWAMIFPRGGPLPRHPSQLYQAFFEGVLLFLRAPGRVAPHRRPAPPRPADRRVLRRLRRRPHRRRAVPRARCASRLSRGRLLTMGMLLSVPLLVFGGWLIARAYRRPAAP